MQTDFFTSSYGNIQHASWRRYHKVLNMLDALYDARLASSLHKARRAASIVTRQRILISAVSVPGREEALQAVIRSLACSTRHALTMAIAPMGDRGKFDNINLAISAYDLAQFDWLMILDDDIALPPHFLDLFVYYCHRERLQLAMPAHRFLSHKTFAVTERQWASTVRLTGFVEIGPLTILHSSLFPALLPFPGLRFAWGLDVLWSREAKRHGWRLGVVDATPIRHLRPIGQSYDGGQARQEAEQFLAARKVTLARSEIFGPDVKIY